VAGRKGEEGGSLIFVHARRRRKKEEKEGEVATRTRCISVVWKKNEASTWDRESKGKDGRFIFTFSGKGGRKGRGG